MSLTGLGDHQEARNITVGSNAADDVRERISPSPSVRDEAFVEYEDELDPRSPVNLK